MSLFRLAEGRAMWERRERSLQKSSGTKMWENHKRSLSGMRQEGRDQQEVQGHAETGLQEGHQDREQVRLKRGHRWGLPAKDGGEVYKSSGQECL